MRKVTIIFTLYWLILAVGTAYASSVSGDCVEPNEESVGYWINMERNDRGIPSLTIVDSLSASAEHMVQDMSHYGYFGHYTIEEWTPGESMIYHGYPASSWKAQVIEGVEIDPHRVVLRWLDSPDHRDIVLDPKYVSMGVGYTHLSGSPYGVYWDVDFGSVAAAPANRC